MGIWSAYFILKLLLYVRGDIDFNPWLNLGFAAFTALAPGNRRQRLAKNLIAISLGVVLLYHDSYLPPPGALLERWSIYARQFQGLDVTLVLELVGAWCVYELARRKVRLGTFVFIGIFLIVVIPRGRSLMELAAASVPVPATERTAPLEFDAPEPGPAALDADLAAFFREEATAHIDLPHVAADAVPFDIVVLQVAALSWSDLRMVELAKDPLLDRFDIVLSHFNSAALDGAAAAQRFARSRCGQIPERRLYEPAGGECSPLRALESAGFEVQSLTSRGHPGAAAQGDYARLTQWRMARAHDPARWVALHYETDTLEAGDAADGGLSHAQTYAARWSRLSGDLGRFLDDLRSSGRPTLVMLVGEYGAALVGDARQMPGLREIPTPALTEVPAGVALINATHGASWTAQLVEAPTSYLALNALLGRFIANDPFDTQDWSPVSYVRDLPGTEFVAENRGATVLRVGGRTMLRSSDGSWSHL